MTHLLDTNICSGHMRRPGGLAHYFFQYAGRIAIPSVVLAELYAGAYKHPNSFRLLGLIADLLQEVAVLDFDSACAMRELGPVINEIASLDALCGDVPKACDEVPQCTARDVAAENQRRQQELVLECGPFAEEKAISSMLEESWPALFGIGVGVAWRCQVLARQSHSPTRQARGGLAYTCSAMLPSMLNTSGTRKGSRQLVLTCTNGTRQVWAAQNRGGKLTGVYPVLVPREDWGRVYEFQFLRRVAISWPWTWGRKK